jgi:arylsulfatase
MIPTLMAAVGEPDIKEKLKKGHTAGDKTFKVHLDGYNFLPYIKGEAKESPRREVFYFDQGGNLNALRYNNWKLHFVLLEGDITTAYRKEPAWPRVINLRADPFEKAPHESRMYFRWMADQMWLFVPAQQYIAQFLETFKEFPAKTGSTLSIGDALKAVTNPKR